MASNSKISTFILRHKKPLIVIGSLTILAAVLFSNRKGIRNAITDYNNDSKIATLQPDFSKKVRKFLKKAKSKGISLKVDYGYRSKELQDKLYSQGRTAPGDIVTNAKGGESPHNYGLAVDVYEVADNGSILWETPRWDVIGQLGKDSGMIWGGDFKSIKDRPHFEEIDWKTKKGI